MMGSLSRHRSRFQSKSLMIRLQHIATHFLLIVGAFLVLFPLFWMLSTSLKPPTQVKTFPPVWIPKPIVWENYVRAVTIFPIPFYVFVANSTYISLLNVVGTMISNPIIAYAFARLRFRGSRPLFYLVLATMMLPGQVTMIPLFLLFRALHWVNTYNPLIVPAFFGNAYFVFLLRQFFSTIPRELDDAAKIDGCGVLGIFFRIILPLSKPALGIMAIFTFTWAWNDFMGPLIYVSEMKMYPLSVALSFLRGTYRVLWSELMVVSFIAMLPPVALFFVAQRSYIQGIVVTGLKG